MAFAVNFQLKGPIVEGHGALAIRRMTAVAVEEIADYTHHEVLMQLVKVLREPTGYYESRIVKERVSVESYSINDSNVIYGPWLEGIGSRNYPVTKFEGYHTFRIVRNRMLQKAAVIAEAAILRQMGELE
ncbi:hypothetical protein [Streptomyces murinus]|uniref:hypothetical protein n=1 Tax=Streptomyces murinus TaxID=33900 RepID=UPI003803B8E5